MTKAAATTLQRRIISFACRQSRARVTDNPFADLTDDFFSAEEIHSWFPFFVASNKVLARLDSDVKRRSRLSLLDFHLLLHLASEPDRRARMSDLSEVTGADPSTITYRITRLEKNGWVTREQAGDDRRGVLAVITSAGQDKVIAAAPSHVAAVRREFLSTFSASQLKRIGSLFADLAIAQGLPPKPHGRLAEALDPDA